MLLCAIFNVVGCCSSSLCSLTGSVMIRTTIIAFLVNSSAKLYLKTSQLTYPLPASSSLSWLWVGVALLASNTQHPWTQICTGKGCGPGYGQWHCHVTVRAWSMHFYCSCRNLLSLKYHHGNIEDLSLNFTITVDHMGQTRVRGRGNIENQLTLNFLEIHLSNALVLQQKDCS